MFVHNNIPSCLSKKVCWAVSELVDNYDVRRMAANPHNDDSHLWIAYHPIVRDIIRSIIFGSEALDKYFFDIRDWIYEEQYVRLENAATHWLVKQFRE